MLKSTKQRSRKPQGTRMLVNHVVPRWFSSLTHMVTVTIKVFEVYILITQNVIKKKIKKKYN